MRTLVSVVSAVVLALATTSCGSGPAAAPEAPASPAGVAPSTLPEGMGSVRRRHVPADGGPLRRIDHHRDRPGTVAAVSTGQLDGLLSLGVVPIGTTTARGASLVPDYLAEAFPEHRSALAAMPRSSPPPNPTSRPLPPRNPI